jgi:hypothetical protein
MRIVSIVREMNDAVARLTELRLSRAAGLAADRMPGTYAEFLLLTAATTRHEPSARRRAAGKPVR